SQKPSGYAVVPLDAGADTKRLTELLRDPLGAGPKDVTFTQEPAVPGQPAKPPVRTETNPMANFQGERIGNVLVFSDPGILKGVKEMTPAARPELDKALGTAGNAGIKAAFIPPEGLRAMMTFGM